MYRLLVLLSPLVVAIAASHDAAVPAGQAYWNKVLPNTPMPNAIKDLLTPSTDEFTDNKYGTAVNVGKGGVSVNTGKPKPGGTSVNVGKGGVTVNTGKQKPGGTSVNVGHGGVNVNTGKGRPGGTNVNVGHGGVNVNTGSGKGTSVNVGHGGVIVNTPSKKKPVHVAVGVKGSPFLYRYAATENQVRDDPNTALFFLEKDLQAGTQMTLHFTPTTSGSSTFISRQQANSIPFTSSKFPEILKHFSVEPNSVEADSMKETLSVCEEPANEGESKYCATSLESMVDFSRTRLGSHKIQAISTSIGKKNSPKQLYSISSSGIQRLPGSNLVVCHAEAYAYAVFYCHTTRSTKAYQVSMVGKDGTKVEAVAVCHTDTASWNPKHIAFKVLNVKPGSVPVCHFLPQDHLVWSPKR